MTKGIEVTTITSIKLGKKKKTKKLLNHKD